MAIDLSKFRIVKHVTRPLLRLIDNKPVFVKMDGPFRQAEATKNPQKDASGNPVPPPFLADIVNLETDQPSQMVANEVFKSELQKQYPNDSYVGKYFELTKITKAEGKRYNTFTILEIAPEVETVASESDKAPVTGKKK
jgi:hypothetical protein